MPMVGPHYCIHRESIVARIVTARRQKEGAELSLYLYFSQCDAFRGMIAVATVKRGFRTGSKRIPDLRFPILAGGNHSRGAQTGLCPLTIACLLGLTA